MNTNRTHTLDGATVSETRGDSIAGAVILAWGGILTATMILLPGLAFSVRIARWILG